MSCEQADIIQYHLGLCKFITSVKVHERTMGIVVTYVGSRDNIIRVLREFNYNKADVPSIYLENSGRRLNNEYYEKLITKTVVRYGAKAIIPLTIRELVVVVKSLKYIWEGIKTLAKGRLEVPVLDATAIGVSVIRGDYDTASSVMFLLGIGETLEEWTHKKSVNDLARSMSLNVGKVWQIVDGRKTLVKTSDIKTGDEVVVYMGSIIPFDGVVSDGEAMVNQSSMTGESLPVRKVREGYVYAGTVVEEGEITIVVKEAGGSSRFEKIIDMIEETQTLKSELESKAAHLADKLVPYTLGGTLLTYLLTRNTTKALSILMVDFSCALKLAMPISVLSAIREASMHNITVKGGRYLEDIALADTIVFDKTGTLTKARPTVARIISFNGEDEYELLRLAACMEEHFPHSMAKAVVEAAQARGLTHDERHSRVEYIVAHGISTTIDEKKAVIGSFHFVFEDEGCVIPQEKQALFDELPKEYSCLYLAIDGRLAAVICIEDPLREEAAAVVSSLRKAGIKKVVMMTGDSKYAARSIAAKTGVDECHYEVLPEDKASYIQKEKDAGHKVVMIGDGINDSPALSVADVGIAISDGAELAREIADITIGADNLYEIVTLKAIADGLTKRTHRNYRQIVGINGGLIALGVTGIIQPATSALLHNMSTLAISLKSMDNILK